MQKSWWKVRVAKDGTIRDCIEVSKPEQGDETELYVLQPTKEAAINEAKVLYTQWYGMQLREARKAMGECYVCGAKATGTLCEEHKESAKMQRIEREALRKALGLGPKDSLPPQHRLKKHRSGFGLYTRMHFFRALSEVEEAFKNAKTDADFMRWLRNRIAVVAPPRRKDATVHKLRKTG